MDFRVGGAIQLSWKNKPCPYPGMIEVIEKPQRFAFRWPSYAISHPEITFDIVPSTLVDITLEERADQTLLTLVESGFASQPQPVPAEELSRMRACCYQLTPLKRVCLATCCTPLNFIHDRWHDGYMGAFRMGLEHGILCLGSNGLLCVLLPLGIMNITVMTGLTVLIFAENMFPRGERIAQGVGLALILYGALVVVVPAALPT